MCYFEREKNSQYIYVSVQTHCKIWCVGCDPASSDIVVHHASAGSSFCKSDCTPAGHFASHVKDQLVVVIRPTQHEIVVWSSKHSVIQCINYMERKWKQDKHKQKRSSTMYKVNPRVSYSLMLLNSS